MQVGCTRFSRCCYLISDLCSPFRRKLVQALSQSPDLGGRARLFAYPLSSFLLLLLLFFFLPDFLSFSQRNFAPGSPRNDDGQFPGPLASPVFWGALHSRPRHASLCGYCAVVRIPLHSPTTDAAVPLAFSPPQPRLAFFALFPPRAASFCPQRRRSLSAPKGPRM